jgi:hypothetical protein
MSKKIDESFLKAFAGNMAAYVAGRALASNTDKIKSALGIDSQEFDDIDDEMAAVRKAQDRLSKALEKKIQSLPPDEQKDITDMVKRLKAIK